MLDKDITITQESQSQHNGIFTAAIISLFLYVFFSDFAYAVLHLGILKPVSALCTVLFAGSFFALEWKNISHKIFLCIALLLTVLYIAVLHNQSSNYLYTPIFGILMIQRPNISKKCIDKVFVIQLVLLAIEFVTRNHLYTQVITGLFTIREIDFDYETIMDETGFKAKGMFIGVLVATCFAINYSLINRNNYRKSFWGLVMAVLTNGRLAMLICGSIYIYNIYMKKTHYKANFNVTYLVLLSALLVIMIIVFAAISSSLAAQNLLNVFNMDDPSNAGRVERYGLGLNALLNYSPIEFLFGSTYELFDQWNRPVPTESDVLGMLLEIGILGFSVILYGVIIGWRSGHNRVFMSNLISHKYAILMSVIAMIQYRHLSGNMRGLMFWFLILLIINENKNYETCK